VINGAGAAGIRIAEMLRTSGVSSIVLCDSKGVVRKNRTDLNPRKRMFAVDTSARSVAEAMKGAHVFIGVSVADCIKPDYVRGMADFPAIFAMANPDPEIRPEAVAEAMGRRPYVIATGRSDYPNQVNNVLGFPFLFRGALDARANSINMEMKIAAADALATIARKSVPYSIRLLYNGATLEFGPEYIIPKPFDPRLFVEVPLAVATAAVKTGAAANMNLDIYRRVLQMRNIERLRGTPFEGSDC
jgi:malate dehydrogenase (oxaloacetate-decarboxylating)(NADP+)